MAVDFSNIYDHVIPMDKFILKWRFMDEKYDKLPDLHLDQFKPLDGEASKFLWDYISGTSLHDDIPFKKDFFRAIDKAHYSYDTVKEIKKWLYHRGLPFAKNVFLSWQPDTAMIVPWKLFIKYVDSFYYAEDLTIIDQSLNWALFFYHEHEIYFGTKKDYKPSDELAELNFIW